MRLQWDTALLIGLVVLTVVWVLRRRFQPQRSGIRFSTIDRLRAPGKTWAGRVRWMIPGLRWLAMLVLLLALARPQKGNEQQRVSAEGIAIQMVLDRSGSMRQAMRFGEGELTRPYVEAITEYVKWRNPGITKTERERLTEESIHEFLENPKSYVNNLRNDFMKEGQGRPRAPGDVRVTKPQQATIVEPLPVRRRVAFHKAEQAQLGKACCKEGRVHCQEEGCERGENTRKHEGRECGSAQAERQRDGR